VLAEQLISLRKDLEKYNKTEKADNNTKLRVTQSTNINNKNEAQPANKYKRVKSNSISNNNIKGI